MIVQPLFVQLYLGCFFQKLFFLCTDVGFAFSPIQQKLLFIDIKPYP